MRWFTRFKEQPEWVRVATLTVLAALLYASFNIGLPQRYNSPDEAANAFFARRLAQGDSLAAPAPLNTLAGDALVHPRSTRVIGRKLAPASFLGFPLIAGGVARLFGSWLLPFITALGAVLGLTAAYFCLNRLSGPKVAAVASTLLAFLPAYWYYHARGFFHNALFFDFLLVAGWGATCALQDKRPRYYLLAGLAAGVSLALRTSELFWVLTAAAIVLALSWREVRPKYLLLTVLGAALAFTPVLISNYGIYGQFFSVGYRPGFSLAEADIATTTSLLAELVLPFGFNPEVIGSTTQRYLWQISWWWAVLAAAGLVFVVVRLKQAQPLARRVLLAGVAAACWLVVLYGSWQFNDNPDPAAVTLGTSYVRYWLPLYAFFLWPAAELIAWLWQKRWGRAVGVGLFASYLALSALVTLFEPQEGLVQVGRNVRRFDAVSREVQSRTEPGSVVVTDGITDKLFWPAREVIVSEEPVQHLVAIKRLLEAGKHVYRYHPTWSSKDLAYLNSRRLKLEGMAVEPVVLGVEGYSLYRFSLR